MKNLLPQKANDVIAVLNKLPMVKDCTIYGSISTNTFDELSDIDIMVDVSGYDNGKFMLEIPYLLKDKLGIIYSDFAPSLIPNSYIVSNAIDVENPFTIVDLNCIATPHCTTVTKEQAINDVFIHTLKISNANLKHFARGSECYNDIIRMAKRLKIKDVDLKDEAELLEDTLIWLKKNQNKELGKYVNSCRDKFDELV